MINLQNGSLLNNKSNNNISAFTIVELLVVIVIIGILAAITIVSYSGISNKAIVASLQSDLDNNSKQLRMYNVEYGYYPTTIDNTTFCPTVPTTDVRYCLKASTNTTLSYTGDGQTFILTATKNGTSYRITDSQAPFAVTQTSITSIAAIVGIAEVSQTLTVGAIAPSGATVLYQWQIATTAGGVYTNISGATNNTYVVTSGDVNNYLKVVVTGTGGYIGTQTSAATAAVSDPWAANWYPGIAATALAGKHIYKTDLGSGYLYKTTNTAVTIPQGAVGLDPNYPSNMVLVSPQTNPGVDFSAYPAQNACKAIGGRLPNMQELSFIYAGQAAYGNNFAGTSSGYWSSTELNDSIAWYLFFGNGSADNYYKSAQSYFVRCVAD